MKPTAKEYYEKRIEEYLKKEDDIYFDSINTLSLIHVKTFKENTRNAISFFKNPGKYSNCLRTSELIEELISVYPEDISQEVKKIFLVKSFNYEIEAAAEFVSDEYNGYLITYWEGQNILFHLISILYSEYYDIQDDLYCKNNGKEKKSTLTHEQKRRSYQRNLITLLNFIHTSQENEFVIHLKPEYNFSSYEDGFMLKLLNSCIAFVISHEIGHHILKHTSIAENTSIKKFISLPSDFSNNHKLEFEADLFAAKSLSLLRNTTTYYDEYIVYIAPLLSLSSFGLLFGDSTEDSDTHPSISKRYLNLAHYIDSDNPAGYNRLIFNTFLFNLFASQAKNSEIEKWWEIKY